MKITTSLAVAFACATLAACGGGNEANNDLDVDTLEANTLMTDNLGTDMNMDINTMDMNLDMNATDLNTANTMDTNTTTNTL